MQLDYKSAELIASCTEGKLSADDVINLATYGTTNAQDMNPFHKCPDAYSHMTQGY